MKAQASQGKGDPYLDHLVLFSGSGHLRSYWQSCRDPQGRHHGHGRQLPHTKLSWEEKGTNPSHNAAVKNNELHG